MKKITHLISGGTIGFVIAHIFSANVFVFGMVGSAYGILPDYDIYMQKIGVMRHRSPVSHSLLSSIVYSSFPLLLNYVQSGDIQSYYHILLSAGAFLSILSHNLLDCITRSGVKFFYPFSKKKIRGRFRSDDTFPNIITITVFVLLMAYFLIQ